MLGKIEKGTAKDEMVGWHHRLNAHEFEQTPGVGKGQGSLACCSAWGHKESDTTERLNNNWLLGQCPAGGQDLLGNGCMHDTLSPAWTRRTLL